MMRYRYSWLLPFLVLGSWVSLASCGGGGTGINGPVPAAINQEGRFQALKYILDNPNQLQTEDPIGVVCVGLGETGSTMPSPAFLERFAGHDPPVMGSFACDRSMVPGSPYPVVRTPGGVEGLLVYLGDVGETIDVRIEQTGLEPRTLRCETDLAVETRTLRFVTVSAPGGRVPPPPPVGAGAAPAPAINIRGCELLS